MSETSKSSHEPKYDLDEVSKEQIEKMTSSQYFDYLADNRIKAKVVGIVKKYQKWVILINGLVVLVFGVSILQAIRSASYYEEQAKAAEGAIERAAALTDSVRVYYETIQQKSALIESANTIQSEVRLDMAKMRQGMLAYQQDLLKQKEMELDEKLTALNELQISEQLADFKATESSMTSLEQRMTQSQDSLEQKVAAFDYLDDEIKKAASTTYMVVERGDEDLHGNEFRPTKTKLPYSEDWLEATFHDRFSTHDPKELMLDLYGNGRVLFDDLFLNDSTDPNSQTSVQFCSSDNRLYELTPTFMYFPPNFFMAHFIPGYGRVPDFVILKIRLLDMNCTDTTVKRITAN